jgi:hypothetical protein
VFGAFYACVQYRCCVQACGAMQPQGTHRCIRKKSDRQRLGPVPKQTPGGQTIEHLPYGLIQQGEQVQTCRGNKVNHRDCFVPTFNDRRITVTMLHVAGSRRPCGADGIYCYPACGDPHVGFNSSFHQNRSRTHDRRSCSRCRCPDNPPMHCSNIWKTLAASN